MTREQIEAHLGGLVEQENKLSCALKTTRKEIKKTLHVLGAYKKNENYIRDNGHTPVPASEGGTFPGREKKYPGK